MSAKVSTLLNVDPGGGRYVFLLIGWNDYADPVPDELNRQADAFGMDLGPSGVLVQAYPQRMYEIAKEVLGGLNRSKQIRPADSRIPEAAALETLRSVS